METDLQKSRFGPISCAIDEHPCFLWEECVSKPENPQCIKSAKEWAVALREYYKNIRPLLSPERQKREEREMRGLIRKTGKDLGITDPELFEERIEDDFDDLQER